MASVQPTGLSASSLSARRCSALMLGCTFIATARPLGSPAATAVSSLAARRRRRWEGPSPKGKYSGPGPTPSQFLRCPERARD
jgi:hypothetical protein